MWLKIGTGGQLLNVIQNYVFRTKFRLLRGHAHIERFWLFSSLIPALSVMHILSHVWCIYSFLKHFWKTKLLTEVAQSVQWLCYGPDDWGSVPDRGRGFSLCHHIQMSSGAHPASCLMDTWAISPRSKVARVWHWPLTSNYCLFILTSFLT